MNEKLDGVIAELKKYGLTEQHIANLMQLAFEDFEEELREDLVNISDDDFLLISQELGNITLENLTSPDVSTTDIYMQTLRKVYGASAQNKLESFLLEYFQDALDQAKKAKELLEKYQSGDPDTVKKVEDAKKIEDYDVMKTLIEEMNKDKE